MSVQIFEWVWVQTLELKQTATSGNFREVGNPENLILYEKLNVMSFS